MSTDGLWSVGEWPRHCAAHCTRHRRGNAPPTPPVADFRHPPSGGAVGPPVPSSSAGQRMQCQGKHGPDAVSAASGPSSCGRAGARSAVLTRTGPYTVPRCLALSAAAGEPARVRSVTACGPHSPVIRRSSSVGFSTLPRSRAQNASRDPYRATTSATRCATDWFGITGAPFFLRTSLLNSSNHR